MAGSITTGPLCCLLVLCLPSLCGTSDKDLPSITTTNVQGAIPSHDATIVRYSVETTDPDNYVPTGDLSIEYSDGTKIVEHVPTAQQSADEIVFREVGFSDIIVSDDKRTIGWSEVFENPGTSYAVPLVVAIYQSGKTIMHIQQGQMLWDWTFLDGANHIAAVWGLTHGSSMGDYQLYDVQTGQMVSEFMKDTEDQSQRSDIPAWVRRTDQIFRHDDSRGVDTKKKSG